MSKSQNGKNQHVVPRPDGWAVKSEGAGRATRVTTTQREAMEIAREIAKNQGSERIVHGENGRIRQKNSYGNDPHPPKG
jgi:adenylyl- and sulfurtransferase ThiI